MSQESRYAIPEHITANVQNAAQTHVERGDQLGTILMRIVGSFTEEEIARNLSSAISGNSGIDIDDPGYILSVQVRMAFLEALAASSSDELVSAVARSVRDELDQDTAFGPHTPINLVVQFGPSFRPENEYREPDPDPGIEAAIPLMQSVFEDALGRVALAMLLLEGRHATDDRPPVMFDGYASGISSASGDLTVSRPAKRRTGDTYGLMLKEAPYAPVSSEFVFYEAARALSQPNIWHRDETTHWPTIDLNSTDAKGHLQLVPTALDAQVSRSPEERDALEATMERYRKGLSPRTRAVLRAVEILWRIHSNMNATTPVTLRIDDILDAMGRTPKHGAEGRRSGHHAEARRAVLEELAVIQALQIRATVTVKEKGKNVEKHVLGRLFLMTLRVDETQPDGTLDVQAVTVTPDGRYGHYLLTNKHMPYDTRLLAENPKTHGMVINLVEAIYEDWRRNDGGGRARNWLGLLAEIGVQPYKKPYREIERAERVFAHINGKGYASIDWSGIDVSEAYGHGASKVIARAQVIAEPPEHVRAKYAKSNIGRGKREALATAPRGSLAPKLTAARLSQSLTQAQAAEDAGIPQQTFSRAERGNNLSQENRRKLERWLARVAPPAAE